MARADATTADVAVDVSPAKGKKKLILVILAALVLALVGGGVAVYLKQKAAAAAAAEEDDDYDAAEGSSAPARREHGSKAPPTFVTLEPFVVNLADRESDRYAQIGVVLEVDDPKIAEDMKVYMPAIRNGILMVLSHKTSTELLSREGKLALAREIMRESVLPLGINVRDDSPARNAGDEDDEGDEPPRRNRRKGGVANPVKHVHFSNFIVQ